MHVTFRLPAAYRSASDVATIDATGATVAEAFLDLASHHPALAARLCDSAGRPHGFVSFYVNEDDIRALRGLDTPLTDGDEVTIVPAIAGG